MQELQESCCFGVFGAVLRDCREESFGFRAEGGEFDEVGRVEQHVGFFLERVDPFDFGSPDVRPVGDGFADAEGSLEVVAHDSPEEAVVACRDAVVAVQGDGGDCVDEYLVFLLLGDLVREARIEGVDAFQQHDGAFSQFLFLSVVFFLAGHEVVLRDIHFFAAEELQEVALEVSVVDCLEVVEVVGAVGERNSRLSRMRPGGVRRP